MGQAVGCLGRYAGRAVPGMGGVGAGRYAGRAVRGTGGRYAPGLLGPSILLLGRYGAAYRPRGTTRKTTTTRTRKISAIWLPEAVPPPPLTLIYGTAAGRAKFSLSTFGLAGRRPSEIFTELGGTERTAAGRAKFSPSTFGLAGRRPSEIFAVLGGTGRYGTVPGGTGRYGAVRGGTGRYASGPAQPFNFAFGRYAGPVEQQEQQEQQQEQQGKKLPFRS